ncbi:MAG: hypothetical protein LIP11_00315 [Clostridiales bacterium]|nr:hypothetical protein [Clostridiales bacterium]
MIKTEKFGFLSDGRTVHSYTIENSYGEYVTLLDYGATIYRIVVRDRDGALSDVVLGAPEPEELEDFPFSGITVCFHELYDWCP